jgi:hypothetical protein
MARPTEIWNMTAAAAESGNSAVAIGEGQAAFSRGWRRGSCCEHSRAWLKPRETRMSRPSRVRGRLRARRF